jgi:uncharacterized protein YdhG (YjbR/CyaY superfamily)
LDEATELNIGNICGGAVPEVFEREVQEILENIADLNTKPDAKRQITLTFDFAPGPDRKSAVVLFSCKSKQVGVEPKGGTIFFSKRLGKISAFTEDPRQDRLFAKEAPASPNAQ